jgi:hypothetical protein
MQVPSRLAMQAEPWLAIAAPIDIPRHHLLPMERCLHAQEVASAVRRS